MNNFIEFEENTKAIKSINLDDFSVEDLDDYIAELDKRLSSQKGIKVEFNAVTDANHFFSKIDEALIKNLDKYIKKETALY